jgi:hypothetical protein
MAEFALEEVGIAADVEVPAAVLAGVVHGGDPALRSGVLGEGLGIFKALDLQKDREAGLEPHEEVGLVGVVDALELVGDEKAEVVVAGVTIDDIIGGFDVEGRG